MPLALDQPTAFSVAQFFALFEIFSRYEANCSSHSEDNQRWHGACFHEEVKKLEDAESEGPSNCEMPLKETP
jgi:hypothetical protein